MCDDDKKKVGEGEGPEAPSPTGLKRPLRGRTARTRNALQDLAFFLNEGLRADGIAPNTRAKLLAWAAIYGVGHGK